MKKLLFLFSLMLCSLCFSCSNDDNKLGDKAEEAWNHFVQKHLVGEWVPNKIEIKPIIGEVLLSTPYPHKDGCDRDILSMSENFEGAFSVYSESCSIVNYPFKWKHQIGTLSFEFDNRILTAFLLKKSNEYLVLDFKAIDALPILTKYYPDIATLPAEELALLVVKVTFLKKAN
ncbi:MULTISPECIES: hypothetical protein [Myroides]|uniref:Lipocalin-like domain-containing protein n=1 Tax=Myroides albus TaxID=2562892 RepID=A0A6I3LAT4_9FLAO|nr:MULTISPECIES: hypothetical protein [Myroides]MTG96539.1 hypothetical protein [Myroides albus]MVX34535.1 hypothetical protein [Myroides sp. LoEW2-1]UVD81047.1 hypothetical protein NWE55_07310 [Myroides albus]